VDNTSGKGPQEVFHPTSCSQQGWFWDQTRLLRAWSSLVYRLEAAKTLWAAWSIWACPSSEYFQWSAAPHKTYLKATPCTNPTQPYAHIRGLRFGTAKVVALLGTPNGRT